MNRIILSSLDYERIFNSVINAEKSNSISEEEAKSLIGELESAQILDPQEMPRDRVTMNSITKITFVNTGKKMDLKIVYPQAADISNNLISIFSPIATALIGRKVGDTIELHVPSGPIDIYVDEIIYQPEAAGQFNI